MLPNPKGAGLSIRAMPQFHANPVRLGDEVALTVDGPLPLAVLVLLDDVDERSDPSVHQNVG